MLLNSKSIFDQFKHKYVLAKFTTWTGLKSAYFPVASNISILFNRYVAVKSSD